MTPTAADLPTALSAEIRRLFARSLKRIEHCVAQLDDAQVWWRPTPEQNSVANLLLHLRGNVTQWIISGIGGAADVRNRPQEFAERGPIPAAELVAGLRQTLAQVETVLAAVLPADWLQPRRIQGFESTVLGAALETVTHLQGHTQEIISLTRQQLGAAYRFEFVPKSREQGAP